MESKDAANISEVNKSLLELEQQTLDLALDHELEGLKTFLPEDGGNIDSVECSKNPGHEDFIPILKFKVEDLPEEYQEEEIFHNVLLWAKLTVKILVKFVSNDRPETYQGTVSPFPNYKFRGSKRKITRGSGYIYSVTEEDDVKALELKTCPCLLCQKSGEPQEKCWYFTVLTSVHMIFDSSEAERSVIECFYDSDESPPDTVKSLYGITIYPQTQRDQEKMSYVICVTHDEELAVRLQRLIWQRCEYLKDNYSLSFGPTVLISHPHGCSKMITVGNVLHLTVPTGGDYPTDKPILFDDDTECILPYASLSSVPMLDFATAHGVDLPTTDSDSNPTTNPTDDLMQTPSNTVITSDLSQTRQTDEMSSLSHPVPSSRTNDLIDGSNIVDPSSNPKTTLTQDVLLTESSLSNPASDGPPSNFNSDSDSIQCALATDISNSPLCLSLDRSKNPDTNIAPSQASPDETILSLQDQNENMDNLEDNDTYRLYFNDESLAEEVTESIPDPDHLISITLPPKTTFIIPEGVEFARRYINMKALFQFPAETKFHLPNGKEVYLPPEAKFYSNSACIENGYVSYQVKSCPGSSGGCMLLDGGKSFFNTLPHGGAIDNELCLCALRCYPILPSNV